jgi:hypothetical protein
MVHVAVGVEMIVVAVIAEDDVLVVVPAQSAYAQSSIRRSSAFVV